MSDPWVTPHEAAAQVILDELLDHGDPLVVGLVEVVNSCLSQAQLMGESEDADFRAHGRDLEADIAESVNLLDEQGWT